jgi:hypothetical protein
MRRGVLPFPRSSSCCAPWLTVHVYALKSNLSLVINFVVLFALKCFNFIFITCFHQVWWCAVIMYFIRQMYFYWLIALPHAVAWKTENLTGKSRGKKQYGSSRMHWIWHLFCDVWIQVGKWNHMYHIKHRCLFSGSIDPCRMRAL